MTIQMKASEVATLAKGDGTNPYYEKLIRLRAEQPRVFDSLSPADKLSLGYYEAAKRRAELIADDEQLPPAA
jgi:hypothetical protein